MMAKRVFFSEDFEDFSLDYGEDGKKRSFEKDFFLVAGINSSKLIKFYFKRCLEEIKF